MSQIEYFLAVARMGTLTAAAESEHASVSSLSKQIHKLEGELNATLFERHRGKRDVSLTPAGEVFYDFATELFDDQKAAIRLMQQYGSKRYSTLRVGSLPLVGCYGLASALTDFQTAHTGIKLEVYEREQANLTRRLDFGQVSFAIMRTNNLSPLKYSWKPLIQDRLVVALRSTHPLAGGKPVALSQLQGERWVTFDPDSNLYDSFLQMAQHSGFEPNVVASYSRHDLVLCAVRKGIGIALIPAGMLGHADDTVVAAELPTPVYSEIGLVSLRNRSLNANETLLLDFLTPHILDYTDNTL
ncbi:MAG: LysR family transcriptional regulator [Actinomycetes bacterium]|jgi:DNA-binding transcriptional LysR family regulator|nr:LysR family transcriptional regulator [Actinomycetes bacterium]